MLLLDIKWSVPKCLSLFLCKAGSGTRYDALRDDMHVTNLFSFSHHEEQIWSGGLCYKFPNKTDSFSNARQDCLSYGGWPATFKMMNQDQLNAVMEAFESQHKYVY